MFNDVTITLFKKWPTYRLWPIIYNDNHQLPIWLPYRASQCEICMYFYYVHLLPLWLLQFKIISVILSLQNGRHALHLAAENGNTDVINMLITHVANVDAKDSVSE